MSGLAGDGMYERLVTVFAPVEEELVTRLAPRRGERWLDLGSGSGPVALRAAEAGAEVTAIDSTALMLEKAQADAEAAGLGLTIDVGSVEYLPYDDASFDVISSNFGFIFASDHTNVASELARVARPGARLGFTAWKPSPKLGELYRRFTEEPLDGREAAEWGREDHVEDMLAEEFELEFSDGTLWIDAASGEELWALFSSAAPPLRALLDKLDPAQAEEFHTAFVQLYESYREGDHIRAPRRYLLTLGTRR
jgi:SAM-dependent methyltransferase